MVKSVLDDNVNYSESRAVDMTNIDPDAYLYETDIFGKTIMFALGKPNYTYVDNNIIYYSIYLIENDELTTQIGVYEIMATEEANILDAEGDIDLNKFASPLLYAFTYEKVIGTSKPAPASASKKKTNQGKWIQEFMGSENYDIIDTKYDGNCFFSILQMALAENDQEQTLEELRDILVDNADEELFQNYKTLYDSFVQADGNLTREIKNITKRHNDLTKTIKKTKDNQLLKSFEKQFPEMEKIHETLKRDRKQTRQLLQEYAFMQGIDNLSMLKLKMKTSEYWADHWAVSTLERELNIKTIIFSQLNYVEDDMLNVLQCGNLDDKALEERGIFEPSFYILVAYHGGYHYQMISHNDQKTFDFSELPEEVKLLVAEKCLEKISGPYSLIPEFKDYALKLKTKSIQEPIIISSEKETDNMAEAPVELSSDLYDSGTVFRFYSKSTDKPPGKGAGEILGPEGADAYAELARIPDWRKKLSNFWPAEFRLDNHQWLSVEHYYQAAKFKRNNKEFYIQFSLDSPDSSIAKDAALAKAAGGKSGKFKGEVVRPKNIVIDPDFFQKPPGVKFSRGEIEMESAMRAKFSQHPELKQLLLATKKAKLEHITRGAPAIVFKDLMRVRRELRDAV